MPAKKHTQIGTCSERGSKPKCIQRPTLRRWQHAVSRCHDQAQARSSRVNKSDDAATLLEGLKVPSLSRWRKTKIDLSPPAISRLHDRRLAPGKSVCCDSRLCGRIRAETVVRRSAPFQQRAPNNNTKGHQAKTPSYQWYPLRWNTLLMSAEAANFVIRIEITAEFHATQLHCGNSPMSIWSVVLESTSFNESNGQKQILLLIVQAPAKQGAV